MTTSSVHLAFERPAEMGRVHVIIRLALLVALGTIAWSSVYWILYLALPAIAALLIADKGRDRYLGEYAPRITGVLRWLAGAYAYLSLLTDSFPTSENAGPVKLELAAEGTPTTGSALLRILYSLPALILLALLSFAGGLLWIVGAIFILATRRLPAALADFFELLIRFRFRLVAYHMSLVSRYPGFAADQYDTWSLGSSEMRR